MGGRRRRHRIVSPKKRGPPKVFRCPICEGFPLRIIIAKDGHARVQCAYCGFSREDVHVNAGAEPIDVYSKLTAMEGS